MYDTREQWLHAAVDRLRPEFEAIEAPIPDNLHLSCGWSGSGARAPVAGETWATKTSSGGFYEVYISPLIANPVNVETGQGVLPTLVHELVHVVDDLKSKHGPAFRKIAESLGLTGTMTASTAGREAAERWAALADELGPYPHAFVDVFGIGKDPSDIVPGEKGEDGQDVPELGERDVPRLRGGGCRTGTKKQTTRYRKVFCPDCNWTARATRKWIERGLPTCVCGTQWVAEDEIEQIIEEAA